MWVCYECQIVHLWMTRFHSQVLERSLTRNTGLSTANAPTCWMKNTKARRKEERGLFPVMVMQTSLHLLRVVVRADPSVCRTDDAIHRLRLTPGSLSAHRAKGQCACVQEKKWHCVWVSKPKARFRVMTPHTYWFRKLWGRKGGWREGGIGRLQWIIISLWGQRTTRSPTSTQSCILMHWCMAAKCVHQYAEIRSSFLSRRTYQRWK